jgi:hypothetical protein
VALFPLNSEAFQDIFNRCFNFLSARPKINFAYVIIAVAGIIMLVALLSAPRVRKYAREKTGQSARPAATTPNGNQRP